MTEVKPEDAVLLVIENERERDKLEVELAYGQAEREIARLQEEIQQLSGRLTSFRARWSATITPRSVQVSASADAQLGEFPWLKLLATASLAWLAGRMIRR